MTQQGLNPKDIDLIGFHGQTILHRPHERLTVQIGDGAMLAKRLRIPVVFDFRANDMAAGGQGAPLVPIYHQALLDHARAADGHADGLVLPDVVAILNLGGVANVTVLQPGRPPLACDTGPGNALLDDFMLDRTGLAFDRDGMVAARGSVNKAVLEALLAHPFFQQPPPKSLDRNTFLKYATDILSTEDGAATLTAFTALACARLLEQLETAPQLWVVCGGGARNPTMLGMLREALATTVVTSDALDWSSETIEAQAFAYLAVRSRRHLPLTFPSTTGVPVPMTGGQLAMP
jgi:anhydro-N-acetylmuramic acid kinase